MAALAVMGRAAGQAAALSTPERAAPGQRIRVTAVATETTMALPLLVVVVRAVLDRSRREIPEAQVAQEFPPRFRDHPWHAAVEAREEERRAAPPPLAAALAGQIPVWAALAARTQEEAVEVAQVVQEVLAARASSSFAIQIPSRKR